MKSGVSCSRPTCPSVSGRPSFPTPPPPSPSSIAWSTTPTSLRLTGIAIGGALPRPSASRRGRRPRTDGQPVQIPALFHVAQQHGVSRRTQVVTTRRDDTAPPPDLVARQFQAAAPNQLWVADITYIATG